MKKLLELASQGDERALKDLDLDKPVNVKLDPPFKGMGIMRLTGEYNAARTMIAAADRLELGMLAASCRNKVKYLQFIATTFCKTTLENKPIEGGDVADVMKDMLEELDMSKQRREDSGMASEAESDTETGRGCFDETMEVDKGKEASGKEKKSKRTKSEESQCSLSGKGDTEEKMELQGRKEAKSKEKNNKVREDEEGQSSSPGEGGAEEKMDVEYGKETRTKEKKSKVREEESQCLSPAKGDADKEMEVNNKEESQNSSSDEEVESSDEEEDDEKVEEENKMNTSDKEKNSSSSSKKKDKGETAKNKKGRKGQTVKKVTINNSKVRECPLCKARVTHLRRHVVALHVNKGERLALSQLESVLQAAIHGEDTQGKRRVEKRLGKKISFKGRVREKCPLCDKSVLALTTHLQRGVHKLSVNDSIYKNALRMARPFEGKTQELQSCKRKATGQPMVSQTKRRNLTPLAMLVQADCPDLFDTDDNDSDFKTSSVDNIYTESESSYPSSVIPPTPMRSKSVTVIEQNLNDERKLVQENNSVKRDDDEAAAAADDDDDNHDDDDDDDDDDEREEEEEVKEGLDDRDEDESEGLLNHTDEVDEDDASGEEWKALTVSSFYKGRPKGFRHHLLKLFYQHLQDLGGGASKERQASIHAQNVRKLLDLLDPKNDTISCIIEDGGMQMWREWGKPNLENNKITPGTVKSYFSSVGKFLKFIINKVADETRDFPNIDERSLRLASNVLNRLPDWRTAISRKFSHKKWEKVLQVSRRLPPSSTINDLMSTAPAKEAIQILNKSSTGHLVSSRDFITV